MVLLKFDSYLSRKQQENSAGEKIFHKNDLALAKMLVDGDDKITG